MTEGPIRVWVAGRDTLAGAAIVEALAARASEYALVGGAEPDCVDHESVEAFLEAQTPEHVYLVGGMAGGIQKNREAPADLLESNLSVATNVIRASHRFRVKKLLYLSSSCTYPRDAAQPMNVESLLAGPLEPTSESYAVAKIAGMKLCQAFNEQYGTTFITAIPGDTFGPHDTFHERDSHVVASLIMKIHEAKCLQGHSIEVWGSGKPVRDFLFAGDLADACLFLMRNYDGSVPVNVGSGRGVSVGALAEQICKVVGFAGDVSFDVAMPDGAPRKLLDCSPLIEMGWQAQTPLERGLEITYQWYVRNLQGGKAE